MTEDDTFRKLKREPDFKVVQYVVGEALTATTTETLERLGWTDEEFNNAVREDFLEKYGENTERPCNC